MLLYKQSKNQTLITSGTLFRRYLSNQTTSAEHSLKVGCISSLKVTLFRKART